MTVQTVRVALDVPYSADKLYEYRVQDGPSPAVGQIVLVPFGRGNRRMKGVVLEQATSDSETLKTLEAVLSDTSYLNDETASVVFFLKDRYFCTYFQAVRLLLPVGVLQTSSSENIMTAKTQKTVCLTDEETAGEYMAAHEDNLRHTAVIRLLSETGSLTLTDLKAMADVSDSVIKTLEKHGILTVTKTEIIRSPRKQCDSTDPFAESPLNDEQQAATDALCDQLTSGNAHLLYGITGSGKTHVFVKLIDKVLAQGKQAVLMLPEISLTLQLISRFYAHYGEQLAVLHSGLSIGERFDEWNRIHKGEARVVIGTRSAVFAPLAQPGVFIIDEEQSGTYKSETAPKYHAREGAAFRASKTKTLLLLASATPSFESFSKARDGTIGYHELTARFNGKRLPKVLFADMRGETYAGNTSVISRTLADELRLNLQNGEQSLLFINRRGYHSHVSCPKCGDTVCCKFCGIPLTYHRPENRLVCHYCGYNLPLVTTCPKCGAERMRYSGTGTQKAEEELNRLFPELRTVRMDADSVAGRYKMEKILSDFREKKYDVLLGTQMITKGLDFPDVTLVGVLLADMSLYSSDFRAYEHTFSLITQVVGRAGRAERMGRAVIQTYSPSHYVLSYALRQDYIGFYEKESALRRSLLYPPFCDVCQFLLIADTEEEAFSGADILLERIKEENAHDYADLPVRVIAPRVTAVPMVGGRTRVRMLMKCKNTHRQRQMIDLVMRQYYRDKRTARITLSVDMNPSVIL